MIALDTPRAAAVLTRAMSCGISTRSQIIVPHNYPPRAVIIYLDDCGGRMQETFHLARQLAERTSAAVVQLGRRDGLSPTKRDVQDTIAWAMSLRGLLITEDSTMILLAEGAACGLAAEVLISPEEEEAEAVEGVVLLAPASPFNGEEIAWVVADGDGDGAASNWIILEIVAPNGTYGSAGAGEAERGGSGCRRLEVEGAGLGFFHDPEGHAGEIAMQEIAKVTSALVARHRSFARPRGVRNNVIAGGNR